MAKKGSGTVHFEVSFVDPVTSNRRVALAHSTDQAESLAKGFEDEGLIDVQVHQITTTRDQVVR